MRFCDRGLLFQRFTRLSENFFSIQLSVYFEFEDNHCEFQQQDLLSWATLFKGAGGGVRGQQQNPNTTKAKSKILKPNTLQLRNPLFGLPQMIRNSAGQIDRRIQQRPHPADREALHFLQL